MKCKYCNSENLILEKRSKDEKHILDAQQVALICGDCGKYIKWCPKDERKFYWAKMQASKQVEKVEREKELDNIFWKQECDSLQKTLAEKDKEINKLNLMIKTLPNHDTEIEQQIRRQVCDEIRDFIHSKECNVKGMEFVLLLSKLDQIEQTKGE